MPKANPFGKIAKRLAALQSKADKLSAEIKTAALIAAEEAGKVASPKPAAVVEKAKAPKKAAPRSRKPLAAKSVKKA